MACPEMAVDFMLLEMVSIPLILGLFSRDWKHAYALFSLYYLPASIVFMHMFDSDIDIKLMVFAWFPLAAFLGAFVGEWISVFFAFPRLLDLRGTRDAYARVYNWEPAALTLSAFAGYWGVMAFMGYLSGLMQMNMPECSMGLSRTEELIVGGIATGLSVLLFLVPVIVALLPGTFDKVDRRLNLKYFFFFFLRAFVHYFYDMTTMAMWNPVLVGSIYMLLIVVFWIVAYYGFGFINVRYGINQGYFAYDRADGPLTRENVMDDRFSTIPQAQAFIVVGAAVDVTINVALVIGDQFSGFSNHQTILIVAGVVILFWAIVTPLIPRIVYSLWSGWNSGALYAYTEGRTVYAYVQEAAKNMEIARLDLADAPGGANRGFANGRTAYPDARREQTIGLIGQRLDQNLVQRMAIKKKYGLTPSSDRTGPVHV